MFVDCSIVVDGVIVNGKGIYLRSVVSECYCSTFRFTFNWRGQFVSRAQSLLGTERRDASQFSEQRPSERMLGHR